MDQSESGRIHLTEQTDLGILQGGELSATLFLVAINSSILGELGNEVDWLPFADDLAIYITIRNQRVSARVLQGVTNKLDAWAAESGLTISPNKQ